RDRWHGEPSRQSAGYARGGVAEHHPDAPRRAHHLRSRTLHQCNVKLDLRTAENAASSILRVIKALTPAGTTPLTSSMHKRQISRPPATSPGLIVVVTDGEETCGGSP